MAHPVHAGRTWKQSVGEIDKRDAGIAINLENNLDAVASRSRVCYFCKSETDRVFPGRV